MSAPEFLSLTQNFLQPSLWDALNGMQKVEPEKGAIFTLSQLEEKGFKPKFQEEKLEFYLDIPPQLRRTEVIDFRSPPQTPGTLLAPTGFSAFANYFVNQEYTFHDSVSGAAKGRLPLAATFDTAFNFWSWVLEGNGNYREKSQDSPWTRGDIRVVKDFPGSAARLTFGDLNYRTSVFQQFRAMGGISFAKNFDLQPYTLTTPASQNQFFLKSPSTLQVYVNDRLFQRLSLPAGTFDFRNLPLASGLNSVRYEIVDDSGKTEVIRSPFNADPESLKAGLSQYSYSVGFPSVPEHSSYRYQTEKFSTSVFHRYGFSDSFTGGASLQVDRLQHMSTLEALYASSIGSIGLDIARSEIRRGDKDYAARFRYLYRDFFGPGNTQRSLSFSTDTQGRRFAPFGTLQPNNPAVYTLGLNYSQQILGSLGAGIGGTYIENRATSTNNLNSYTVNYTLGKSWRQGWSSNLIASHGKDNLGKAQKSLFFLLSYQIPESGHSVNYNVNTPSRSNRLDWRYTSPKRSNQWNASTGLEKNETQKMVESELAYINPRGEFTVGQQTINTSAGDHRFLGKIRMAGALAFAGGAVGLSRPISDSFAIVTKPSDWVGEDIAVNPDTEGSYDAQVDGFGPGVVSSITSYTHPRLHVDGSLLSRGLSLGAENYFLSPRYKSGTRVRVGSDATVFAYGSIIDAEQKPVALTLGRIIFLDEPEHASIEIFSNRNGEFQAEGLKPGRYELRDLPQLTPIVFRIPENVRGLYNLGILKAGER